MREVSALRLKPPGHHLFVVLPENKGQQGKTIHVEGTNGNFISDGSLCGTVKPAAI
jgi:hypothetical protein